MKNNDAIKFKCGGKRGCSLDEYVIPYGVIDKYYICELVKIYGDEYEGRDDIQEVLFVTDVLLDKMEKEEEFMEKELA